MATKLLDKKREIDIPSLVRGHAVALAGRTASMSRHEFIDLIEANGGKYTYAMGAAVRLVVVGQRDWPLTPEGVLSKSLREVHRNIRREHLRTRVVSEEVFLTAVGLDAYRQNIQRHYTLTTLTQVTGISTDRIRAWVAAGLIRPVKVQYGVWYFDFRQVTTAKTLWELVRSGASVRRLRVSLEALRKWLPEAQEPLEQLAVIEGKRELLVRLENGELLEPDGQLHLDFGVADPDTGSIKLLPGPRTAGQWFEQGIEQQTEGLLAESAESYRQALLAGGPDVRICFNLANVLSGQGKKLQAIERYLQVVELQPDYADGWNNLGLVLFQMNRPDDACSAWRKALAADPHHARARYNLADTLDETGRAAEAAEHWRLYLQLDQTSEHANYARTRLASA